MEGVKPEGTEHMDTRIENSSKEQADRRTHHKNTQTATLSIVRK